MKKIVVTSENIDGFIAQFNEANCTYVIPFEKDLNGTTLTLLANCVLKFENGGMLKNGTLKGDNTFIDAHLDVIFSDMLFGRVSDERIAFMNDFVRPEWFYVTPKLLFKETTINNVIYPDYYETVDSKMLNGSIEFASVSGNIIKLLPKVYDINIPIKIYSGTILEGTINGEEDRGVVQGTILRYTHYVSEIGGVVLDLECAGGDEINDYQKTLFKFRISNLTIEYGESCKDKAGIYALSQDFIGIKLSTSNPSTGPRSGVIENVMVFGFGVGIMVCSASYVKFSNVNITNCLKALHIGKDCDTSVIEFAWFDKIIINVGKRYMSENVTGIELNSGNNIYFNEIDVNDCNTGIYFYTNTERTLFNIFMNRLNITRCATCMLFYTKKSYITRVNISEVTMDYSMYVRTSSSDGIYQIPSELYGLKFSRVTPYMIGDSSFSNIYESTIYTDSVPNHTSISVDTASGLALTSCSFDKMRLLNPIEGFVGMRKLGIINFKSYGEIIVPAGTTQSDLIELMVTNIFNNGVYPMPIVTPAADSEIPQVVFSAEGAALKMKLACQQTSTVNRIYRFYFPQIN